MLTPAQLEGMTSSKTDDWATPQWFFDDLNKEFAFTLDVCASAGNAKCVKFFSAEDDGLAQEWSGTCWMNPPYGRGISKWIEKASTSSATVVCLLPCRTDTSWWHLHVMQKASDIRFLRGRLKFGASRNSAPFPCAVVVFRGETLP